MNWDMHVFENKEALESQGKTVVSNDVYAPLVRAQNKDYSIGITIETTSGSLILEDLDDGWSVWLPQ